MKYIHLIKLLSVLLCMVMLFAACSDKDTGEETKANTDTEAATEAATQPETEPESETEIETETETETEPETEEATEPDTLGPVDPVLENFFGFEYLENWENMDPESLTRLDVDPVGDNPWALLYRTRDVDTKNNVTETYTLYNVLLGKVVFEKTITFEGHYDSFDGNTKVEYDEEGIPARRYPETVLNVQLVDAGNEYVGNEYVGNEYVGNEYVGYVHYLQVVEYTFTEIDEKTREENPDGYFYDVKTSYTYYDMAGTEIASANHDLGVSYVSEGEKSVTYRMGTANVTFDRETMQVVTVVDALGVKQYGEYDLEAAKYGYLLDRFTGTGIAEKMFLEVYNKKTGELVLRYYYNPAANDVSAWVLRNGDVLIQELVYLDDESATTPDFYDYEGDKYLVDHYILDVETGLTEKVEFSYLLEHVSAREDFEEDFMLTENGITLTENAVNLAIGIEFTSGEQIDYRASEVIVLDNDLEVMFKLDRLVNEHSIDLDDGDLGIRALPGGYFMVRLYDGAVGDYAIVNGKGDIMTYVMDSMYVVDKYIITDDGIYDYGMNLKLDLAAGDYVLDRIMGHKIIVTRTVEKCILDNPADMDRYLAYNSLEEADVMTEFDNYYVIDLTAQTLTVEPLFAEDGADNCYTEEYDSYIYDAFGNYEGYRVDITRYMQKVEVTMDWTESYLVTRDDETGKYTLWNADLEHVLTTAEEMYIIDYSEDMYLIGTYVAGNSLVYTVSK